ncbi:MAG TPA: hydrogenase maturation protease [Terriglobales bacterium]|nr:hydrogenase maturation protease [Terriglobales bacterium]
MAPIVVIGYGNPLRGDDAIGWKAAEALRDVYEDDLSVEVFASHQLNPEMAESVAEAGAVIFIDAVADKLSAGNVICENIDPADHSSAFTHDLDPATLLASAIDLYGSCPRAALIGIGVHSCDLGQELSREVKAALPKVVAEVKQMIERHRTGLPFHSRSST